MWKFCHSGPMRCDWFIKNISERVWLDNEGGNTDLMKQINIDLKNTRH